MADDTGEIGREAAESVGFVNIKSGEVLAQAAMFYAAQGYAESLGNTQANNSLRLAIVSRGVDALMTTSPEEGVTPAALGQILTKAAGNTPPVTP